MVTNNDLTYIVAISFWWSLREMERVEAWRLLKEAI